MKYNLNKSLIAFNGIEIKDDATGKPADLRATLERVCLNCDPRIHASGEEKIKIYRLLKRIHDAADDVEFSSEEVTLLKTLAAEVYTLAVMGPLYEILEQQ